MFREALSLQDIGITLSYRDPHSVQDALCLAKSCPIMTAMESTVRVTGPDVGARRAARRGAFARSETMYFYLFLSPWILVVCQAAVVKSA